MPVQLSSVLRPRHRSIGYVGDDVSAEWLGVVRVVFALHAFWLVVFVCLFLEIHVI